ncbi:MAG: S41 family peptidase [Phycisphaerales bacterium]
MLHTVKPLVACLVLATLPLQAIAQPERVIPSAAAREDAALARRAIDMIHPGLDRYTPKVELDAAFDRLETACRNDITERDFYAELSVALARIRCSHTKAEPSKAWADWRASTPSYLPFRFIEDEGRMIVTRSAAEGVGTGDEVVGIDGVAAREVLATIFAAVPADGWTDSARRFALSSMSDLDESELDHFLPAFFHLGESARLEVRGPTEAKSRVVSVPLLTQDARRAALAEPPPARNLDEAVSLDVRPDGVAILRVGTFIAYRKQIKPADVYRPHFERLAAEKVGTLILDLRDNGGGSDDAAIDLARFLVAKPFTPSSRQWVRTFRFAELTEKLETWDRSVLNIPAEIFKDLGNGYFEVQSPPAEPFQPLEPAFTGRLIVLCGPANASGATLFLAGLRERRTVTLVGEPTGGSAEGPTAGIMLFLPLPNTGIKVRIPAIRSVTGIASAAASGGLDPDVVVRPTLADRLAGRDVALLRAIELAKGPALDQQPR